MKIYKFIPAAAAVSVMLLAAACSDDPKTPTVTPTPGAEVNFGASMTTNDTRTVYGTESGGAFPIYWENGDLVTVMSPGAAHDYATYKITAPTTSDQNYADDMTKTGDAGIQWGNAEKANFYSIYPAGQVQSVNTSNNTMTLRMPHMQNDYIDASAGATNVIAKADMKGGFLYAQTIDVDNGTKTVNLAYKPLATALRFKLQGPAAGESASEVESEVIISNIRIQAPTGTVIAGNFDVKFTNAKGNDGTVAAPEILNIATLDENNGFDYVTIYSSYEGSTGGGYLTLGKRESVTLNAFLIPQSNLTINEDWKIIVTLSDGRTLTRSLGGSATDGKNMVLKPGQIHKLPDLPPLNINVEDYDPSNWMVNIPRNTYLSEISIPGSWNSLGDAQKIGSSTTATSLDDQYKSGIRAFHLDTRWKWSRNPISGSTALSGDFGELGIADGSNAFNTAAQNGKVMNIDAPTFKSALTTITGQVKKDEYLVLMCTFAQNSKVNTETPWYKAISDACKNDESVYDAKQLTSKTVVGDVLGKVIVIICMEDEVSTTIGTTDLSESKCLFVKAPLTLKKEMFNGATSNPNLYQKDLMQFGDKGSTGITLYNVQAQICNSGNGGGTWTRGYAPSNSEREAVAQNILNWSLDNYHNPNYTSTNWIYLGLGGYYGDNDKSYDQVAAVLNPWINGKVTNMSSRPTGNQTTYYPVGIVLMNQVSSYTGTVNNILQLNNKYQKAYNPDWTGNVVGGTEQTQAVKSLSPNHSSAFKLDTETWSVF